MQWLSDVSASSPLVIVGGGVAALVLVLGVLVAVRRRREAQASEERQPGPPDWDAVPRAFPAGGLDELASDDTTAPPSPAPPPEEPPLFWWWMERDLAGQPAARVVILTKDLLLLSGPLGREQVAELHTAQDRGDLLDADLGDDPSLALLSTVVGMEHDVTSGVLRVESHVGPDRRLLEICPPADQIGIGSAVHQVLVDRLGGRRPVQDPVSTELPTPSSDLPF